MVEFFNNPYFPGTQLRSDVAASQFTLFAVVSVTFFDEFNDSYCWESSIRLGAFSHVSHALLTSYLFERDYNQALLAELIMKEYYSHDPLENISLLDLYIVDRSGHVLLSQGRKGWRVPVTDRNEIKKITDKVADLHREASFEAGWDNFCTARSLREEAKRLTLTISRSPVAVTPFFKDELKGFNLF